MHPLCLNMNLTESRHRPGVPWCGGIGSCLLWSAGVPAGVQLFVRASAVGDKPGFWFVSFIHTFLFSNTLKKSKMFFLDNRLRFMPVLCTMAYIELCMCGSGHRLCKLFLV